MNCIWDIFKLRDVSICPWQPRQVPDFETHYQNNNIYNPNDNNFSLISCSEAAIVARWIPHFSLKVCRNVR